MVQVKCENAQIAMAWNITKQVCVLNVHQIRKQLVHTSARPFHAWFLSGYILYCDIPWWLSPQQYIPYSRA